MIPKKVPKLPKDLTTIACASTYSVAVTSSGDVYGWGSNARNKMGKTISDKTEIPTKLSSLSQIVKVSCGYWHMLALNSNGTAFSSGSNKLGELGRAGDSSDFSQVGLQEQVNEICAGF